MSNWFAGIGQAQSGLKAAQYGLTVVSQNITNEATPGYTRQISNQAAVDGSFTTGMHAGRGDMGGVTIVGTARTADIVLDARVRSEHALGGVADESAAVLSSIEQVFPEPIDQGLSAQLGAIWSSFASVANSPQDAGTRTVLLKSLQTVAGTLTTMSSSLTDLATTTSNYLSNDVASANSAATQLAQLNGQISITAATGGNTNALLDTRDLLLDTLSKSFGAVATLNSNGTADVTVDSQSLVTGVTVGLMEVGPSPLYQVSVGGNDVTLSGGSAAGEVGALTSTIPGYMTQLDAVANNLIGAINTIQGAGNDLSGTTGTELLSGTGASDIAVMTTDGSKIAAAGPSGGALDNANALFAANYGARTDSPDASYATLVGDVAAKSALAQQQQSTQAIVVTAVTGLQASVSGVDENEEITNMLTYQHAFSAASRVLTTLDSMLDTLINHTGLVGQA